MAVIHWYCVWWGEEDWDLSSYKKLLFHTTTTLLQESLPSHTFTSSIQVYLQYTWRDTVPPNLNQHPLQHPTRGNHLCQPPPPRTNKLLASTPNPEHVEEVQFFVAYRAEKWRKRMLALRTALLRLSYFWTDQPETNLDDYISPALQCEMGYRFR